MIRGEVGLDRVPRIRMEIAGKEWSATIDTVFNGDLELPIALRPLVKAQFTDTLSSWSRTGDRGGRVVGRSALRWPDYNSRGDIRARERDSGRHSFAENVSSSRRFPQRNAQLGGIRVIYHFAG
jgi:hypothetical protein